MKVRNDQASRDRVQPPKPTGCPTGSGMRGAGYHRSMIHVDPAPPRADYRAARARHMSRPAAGRVRR
ncbi:hypothetical protein ACJQWM_13410 [Lysobacter sp. D1-1-M9]|uniref:hypothetical protein n=1 Tax=Novilysobacter longmucuonensis TaxID=3098603 RepID=UPI002FCBF8DF